MKIRLIPLVAALVLVSIHLAAHPPTAFVTDATSNVYFAYWGGTWKLGVDGQLRRIHANDFHFLALDRTGLFESSNSPGQKITPKGSDPALFTFSDFPAVFHTDGYLYFAPWSVGRIRLERLTSGGASSVFVDAAIDPAIARKGGRHEGGVLAIASGRNGLLYATDGATIWTVTPSGSISPLAKTIVVPNCPTDLPAELPKPHIRSIAVDTNGDVVAAAIGCRAVLRITSDGRVTTILRSENPWSPCAVAVENGNVWIMEYDNALAERPVDGRPRIRKLTKDGKVTTLAVIDKAQRQ